MKHNARLEQSTADANHSTSFEFDDIRLKVGDKLQIKANTTHKKTFSGSSTSDYYTAHVIGYVPEKTLIIYLPETNRTASNPFLEGEQILVRFFNGQCIFSFNVFVEHVAKLPFKHIHLSFPKHISGQTIRKSIRIKSNIETKIALNNQSYAGKITNLSTTGAEITIRADLGEIGNVIDIAFDINLEDKIVSLSPRAIIRSSFQFDKNEIGVLLYGIEFTRLTPDQSLALRSYIYKEMIDNHCRIM
jgi:c-di-GMP-binding flagellar brake protein YcgR